jgi:hypothetical protein
VSLLDDIRGLASQLAPSDLPGPSETQELLGGLVKVLDHQGVVVPADLAEPEPEPVAPTAGGPTTEELLARLEKLEKEKAAAGSEP